ncbi:MAG: hypothetical protein QOG83_2229 [Alphaproteobacteria bacterium]|nr:hypothetical protein [Alphaproteobacteria bacterium]
MWSPARLATMGLLVAACNAAMPAMPAQAQAYPAKAITIVLPLAAGTGMDTIVRLYGERLSASFGRPVLVDNRPGASMMLATTAVASAPADGYTLLVGTSGAMAINPVLFKQVTYDPERDFVPVAFYVKSPFVLVINPSLPVHTVAELIRHVKDNPTLSYSTPGAGLAQHLSMEFMKQRFGLEITHVPYRNSPQSISDIVAGHVHLGFAEVGASLPLIRDGKLRALAVSSSTRLPMLPEVPPFAEAAGAPDFEAVSWHILLAPSKTPKETIDKLHGEMKRILAAPDLKEKIANLGLIPLDTPFVEDINRYMKEEREKWGSLVKTLGLQGSQ